MSDRSELAWCELLLLDLLVPRSDHPSYLCCDFFHVRHMTITVHYPAPRPATLGRVAA